MDKSRFRDTQLHNTIEFYDNIQKVPIENSKRRCTDILCIIVGLALTITLAVFAIITFNRPQYLKQVFPADSDGNTCGYEYPGFNYIYFAKPTEMKNRLCVRSCPTAGDKPLVCKKTNKLDCAFGANVQYYPNDPVMDKYGQFCFPRDPAQQKILRQQMRSYSRDLYYNSVDTIWKCLSIVAIASVLYMFFVQCCPRVMNRVSVVIGALALLALTVTIVIYPSQTSKLTRWIVFGVAILLFLIMICTLVKYFQSWGMNGVYLDFASKFLWNRLYPFLLPILFLGFGVAFYFFQILQYRSFWSFGQLKFDPEFDLYHKVANPTKNIILSAFQIIQIVWGTMFLKEAFNYLISAEAVEWYYGKGSSCFNAAFTLVCKHVGSVIACAFMNSFFGIADFIFDALIPNLDDQNSCFYCINRFAGFFDLSRSDALAVVYLSGNAYCNSARYCEYIANKTSETAFSQSTNRIYRFCAHFALGGLISLAAFWGFGIKAEVSIPAMLILLLVSMGVSTFFISLHADASEAILVLYLIEYEFFQNRKSGNHSSRFTQINNEINSYLNQSGLRERKPL